MGQVITNSGGDMQNNLIAGLVRSRKIFFYFVNECNNNYRSGHELKLYREIIDLHRKSHDLELLLSSEDFYLKLIRTLEAWNMNQRGARLTDIDNLKKSILANKRILIELYKHKLHTIQSLEDELGQKIIRYLDFAFSHLKIMESKRRIVGVSKAMHFLLPDLVMPIDSTYTMPCFYGYNKYSNSVRTEFKTFEDIFTKTHSITNMLNLTPADVDGNKWNTSVPKLIDNAIIGLDHYIVRNGADKFLSLKKRSGGQA